MGVRSVSPPCLYPSGTVESKLLLADSLLWAWESKLLVFPEHHCVMGLCPWGTESSVPMRGGWAHGSLNSLHPWPGEPDSISSRKPSLTFLASMLPRPSTGAQNFHCCLFICPPPLADPF